MKNNLFEVLKTTHVISEWGTEFWLVNDQLHRIDGPAMLSTTGSRYWFRHGKLHREDGPAIEFHDGTVEWYKNDQKFIP